MEDGADSRPLRILVVEDEYLIALQLKELLQELDCHVMGPVPSVAKALSLIESERPDAAILDVNLGKERSTPVAEALVRLSISYALATGYDSAQLPETPFQNVPRIGKPTTPQALREVLHTFR